MTRTGPLNETQPVGDLAARDRGACLGYSLKPPKAGQPQPSDDVAGVGSAHLCRIEGASPLARSRKLGERYVQVLVTNVMPGAPDPLVGRRLYDFVVERKLAQGGMGAVYLLRHEQYPIRKVLKVILSEYANHPAIRERFEREAHAVASLKHPNIAKIDTVSTIDGQPCMLIPFLEGQPLDEYLIARGGRLPPADALHIANQIARGLHYAHGEGIIHRDLKPGNVFVEPSEDDPLEIQILDFGIAKQLRGSAGTSFGTQAGPLGTPAYMAVEQFEHAADVTPAADVWALAVMVWEMTTGRRPWTPLDSRVLYHKQLNEPPEPPPPGTLPPAWEALLRTALSPDPRQRPQSMPALVVPLAWALPEGVDILRKDAPKWLDESVPNAETRPNPLPPPPLPVWAPGIPPITPPGQAASWVSPGPVDTARSADKASVYDRRVQPAIATTLGSANGAVISRSAAKAAWKLALLGAVAAATAGVAVFVLADRRGHEDEARTAAATAPSGAPAPPVGSTDPQNISSTLPSSTVPVPADAGLPNDATTIDGLVLDGSGMSPSPDAIPPLSKAKVPGPDMKRPERRSRQPKEQEQPGSDGKFDRNAAAGD